ncbi:SHOCT domain-containing protein [Natronomonas gomsonensis]|uniref:SHOCT domain-containing protein n=1 Tax=Natronomonas gomsonensis TaxID=1046043 RepID=UPI00227D1086|nr:SHOCT domain-containing protein [Natronomonas gomsonensis]MCY4732867.1 SHOCT domain-containing protein [Natronomonas gomsonensis]
MTQPTTHTGRTARRLALVAVPLLVATTGTAAAHGGGSYGGGMMGGSGWGLFGGAMGLLGLLWMGLLVAVPLYVVYVLLDRGSDGDDEPSLSVLRERYARGELSDDEFERRRKQLERTG